MYIGLKKVVCRVCTVVQCTYMGWFPLLVLLQMDADVRLQWDSYLSAMEVVDRDPLTGTDLLHWVIKLPVSEPAAAGVCRLHPHHAMRVSPPTCQLVVKTASRQTDLSIHDTPCTICVPPFLYVCTCLRACDMVPHDGQVQCSALRSQQ